MSIDSKIQEIMEESKLAGLINEEQQELQELQELEETLEQLDELSKETLGAYAKKGASALEDMGYKSGTMKPGTVAQFKYNDKIDRRQANVHKAIDKLSKGSRASYAKKGAAALGWMGYKSGTMKPGTVAQFKYGDKIDRRQANVHKAIDKLTNEELEDLVEDLEQLDELSKETLGAYAKKGINSLEGMGHKYDDMKLGSVAQFRLGDAIDKRRANVHKAIDKLSKGSRASYVKKGINSLEDMGHKYNGMKFGSVAQFRLGDAIDKRRANVHKAIDKLTNEELEDLVEDLEQLDDLHEAKSKQHIPKDGAIEYRNDAGKLHRVDGPASINANGAKFWWQNGKLHREDGPAVEFLDGYKEYWNNGKLHREDGPAIIKADGTTQHWINGKRVASGVHENYTVDVTEDVDALMFGETLTEEFKQKATTIFESAVVTRVREEIARIEEEYESILQEELDDITKGLTDKIDGYLDYIAEQWISDNELTLTNGVKHDVMESFVHGMKTLFQEHYIDVPDEKYDVLGDMEAKIDELTDKLNEQVEANVYLKRSLNESTRKEIVGELSKGLTATDVEKFYALTEDLAFENEELFKSKVQTLRENYFNGRSTFKPKVQSIVTDMPVDYLEEGYIDPSVAAYVKAFKLN